VFLALCIELIALSDLEGFPSPHKKRRHCVRSMTSSRLSIVNEKSISNIETRVDGNGGGRLHDAVLAGTHPDGWLPTWDGAFYAANTSHHRATGIAARSRTCSDASESALRASRRPTTRHSLPPGFLRCGVQPRRVPMDSRPGLPWYLFHGQETDQAWRLVPPGMRGSREHQGNPAIAGRGFVTSCRPPAAVDVPRPWHDSGHAAGRRVRPRPPRRPMEWPVM